MKYPIRIEMWSPFERWIPPIFSLFPVLMGLLGMMCRPRTFADNVSFGLLVGVGLFFPLLIVLGIPEERYRRGKAMEVDEDGITLFDHEKRTLQIPWSRFGGYRQAPAQVGHLRKMISWTEILDRDGQPIVTVPTHIAIPRETPSPKRAKQWAFFRELDRHVPEDGFPYTPPRPTSPKVPTLAAALSQTIIGGIVTAVSFPLMGEVLIVAHMEELPQDWRGDLVLHHTGLPVMGILGGLPLFLLGVYSLQYRRNPKLNEPRPIAPPLEGPTVTDFYIDHLGAPPIPSFTPGTRYRQVHPEAQRRNIQTDLSCSKAFMCFGLLVTCLLPLTNTTSSKPLDHASIIFCAILFGLMVVTGLGLFWRSRRHLRSLDDVLIVGEDHLVAVRSDGTHRSLPIPSVRPTKDKSAKRVINLGTWLAPYYIDINKVYEAPVDEGELARASSD